jgi:formate/nitrite transporter
MNEGAIGRSYLAITAVKSSLPFWEAFFRGVLCNVLVCMAAWMALAGRSVTDKAVAIVFPVTAFVAAGFEHSIANMYLMPLAMLLGAPIGAGDMLRNLVPVIAGNLIGGSVLVALVYHVIYVRPGRRAGSQATVAPPSTDSGR